MATPAEISARMVRALSISEPELDTGVGTPIRKVIDTVAEAIAESTVDSFLTSYAYDIDTRVGADLDAFAAIFGFYRQQAKKSSGYILLQRTTAAPESIIIPTGSQASTGGSSPIVVQTLVPALFARGTVVLEIPAEAVDGGSQGDIAAGSVTRWLSSIEGITSITNPAPFTGGADVETDEQFRERIKRTMFRNLAGTKDMYLGVALSQNDTTAAEVYGPYERWTERIEIVNGSGSPSIATPPGSKTFNASVAADGVITTGVPHGMNHHDFVYVESMSGTDNDEMFEGFKRISYVVDHNSFLLEDLDGTPLTGTSNTGSGTLYLVSRMSGLGEMSYAFGRDIDFNDIFPRTLYEVDFTKAPPVVTVTDTETVPDGIYEFSFIYGSQGSRNHPFRSSNIISDRVDVWIDGVTPQQANVVAVLDSNNVMDWNAGTYAIGAYRRRDGTRPDPDESSIILPLPLVPILTIPSSLSVGSQVLTEGTDYWIVDRVDHELRGSMESASGIEFITDRNAGGGSLPHTMALTGATNATPVVVTVGTHNFEVGQRVKIEDCDVSALDGDWYISAVAATTITLSGSTAPGTAATSGTVRLFHPVSLDYNFNAAPLQVQRDIEEWRMAATDVLVHKARAIPLRFFVAVILQPGFTSSSIQAAVDVITNEVLRSSGIGGVVQISDILTAIGQITGVDAVRMLSGADVAQVSLADITTSSDDAVVTTSSAHGFQGGDLVDISGAGGATSMNGVWRVKSVGSPTTFTAEFGYLNSAYTSGGSVRSADYATQIMSLDGTNALALLADRTQSPARAIDIHANDTEHFVLHSVVLTVKAQNSWRSS